MESEIIKSYIKELQNGSHRAFNAIYEMYADKLYAFAFAHTKCRQLSNDIVQDTFLKLWINRKTISIDGSLQSLLFTISKNRIIDAFRSQINKVEFDLFIEFSENNGHFENNVENKLNYDEFLKTLKMCKKLLSDRELEIFELSKEKGESIKEIADKLQIAEQTVKNQLGSSLKKIRAQLSKISLLLLLLLALCFIA